MNVLRLTPAQQSALTRAVIFALIQAPIASLFVGFFLRWTSFPDSTLFSLVLAFVVLPVAMLLLARTEAGHEVVQDFPRYALWSLMPSTLYNLARIPMHYLLDIVFWDHWFDYGSAISGAPVNTWQSFIPGTLVHSLQGYVLALGFYILFKPSLRNAILWVIFLSAMYSWTFPTYVLVDFRPPVKWFYVVWWSHFWMGIALWATPKIFHSPAVRRWARGHVARAGALLVALVALYATPYAFVSIRVGTWQFPLQEALDRQTQRQLKVTLAEPSVLATVMPAASPGTPGGRRWQEARYQLAVRVGSRTWTDYIKASKAVDIAPFVVRGRLLHDHTIIATCFVYVEELESTSKITRYDAYIQRLKMIEYTTIPVQCVGSSDAVPSLLATPEGAGLTVPVTVHWLVTMQVIGDRLREEVTLEGSGVARLTAVWMVQ